MIVISAYLALFIDGNVEEEMSGGNVRIPLKTKQAELVLGW